MRSGSLTLLSPDVFSIGSNLGELEISDQKLVSFKGICQNLGKLRALFLFFNNVSVLQEQTFKGCSSLLNL
jgi:hypothetical protein